MAERSLEERVALLERDLEDTQEFAALMLAVTIGKKIIGIEQYRLLRRLFFMRNLDADRQFAAVNTALQIEETASEFIEYMKDSKFPGMLAVHESTDEARKYRSILEDLDGRLSSDVSVSREKPD